MATDRTRRRGAEGGPVASLAVSPNERPSRVTPSKKQLAQGRGKGASGASSRGRGGASSGKGGAKAAGRGGSSSSKGPTSGKGAASSGAARSTPLTGKGRVPEAAEARPGLLSRLLPARPTAATDVEDPSDVGAGTTRTRTRAEARAAERAGTDGAVEDTTEPTESADGRRYGGGAILLVFLGAQLLASIAYGFTIPNTDYDPTAVTGLGGRMGEAAVQYANGVDPIAISEPVPLWLSTLLQLPLWAALILGPMWFAAKRGRGIVADLGLRMKPIDVPVGLAIGMACQLLLVPALYWLVFKAIGVQDISASARALTDRATDPLSILLVFVIVGVGAPIAEEIFFRGMALPIFGRRLRPRWAILASAAFFAATHFQLLQFPALLIFGVILGVLTVRTGRLGPAIWAHLGFNVVAASSLLFGWFLF
jgi:membrane protease YdiL (CAAX protease family)